MVGSVLNNMFHSNTFPTILLHERFHQFVRLLLAAVNINGINFAKGIRSCKFMDSKVDIVIQVPMFLLH